MTPIHLFVPFPVPVGLTVPFHFFSLAMLKGTISSIEFLLSTDFSSLSSSNTLKTEKELNGVFVAVDYSW